MAVLELCAVLLIAAGAPAPQPGPAAERLSLEEAVRRSIARNPTALIAEQEIRRAEGLLKEARAPALPVLTANGIGTRLDSARTTTGLSQAVVPREQLSANVTLSVPILAPQRWLAWSHAGEQVDIARSSAEDARRFVAVSTARTYLNV